MICANANQGFTTQDIEHLAKERTTTSCSSSDSLQPIGIPAMVPMSLSTVGSCGRVARSDR